MIIHNLKWLYENHSFSDYVKFVVSHSTYYIEYLPRWFRYKEKNIRINPDKVNVTIERGRQWLENNQKVDGSISTVEPRNMDVWDTAFSALALMETGGVNNSIDNAIKFVQNGQLENGSFFFNYVPKSLQENSFYTCVETTSVVLLAIYYYGKNGSENLRKGVNYLIKNQNEDGSWHLNYVPGKESRYASITGFALGILLVNRMCPEKTLKKALSYLKTTQQKNGSWGRSSSYYNTESYAIECISTALLLARKEKWLTTQEKEEIDRMLQSCVYYVLGMQNNDGSWSNIGQSSKNISTALYLQTLLNVNDFIDEEIKGRIINAAQYLIEKQEKDGFWHGGKLGVCNVDFFATIQALIALNGAAKIIK